jgi:hypothetical protein
MRWLAAILFCGGLLGGVQGFVIGSRIKAKSGGKGVVFCWLAVVFGVVMVTVKLPDVAPGGM